MAKLTAVFVLVALLVCSTTLVHATRPLLATTHNEVKETRQTNMEDAESCQGLNEDECLMRRTLIAHTDYIYTQHTKP